jgi:hypothetical protein
MNRKSGQRGCTPKRCSSISFLGPLGYRAYTPEEEKEESSAGTSCEFSRLFVADSAFGDQRAGWSAASPGLVSSPKMDR